MAFRSDDDVLTLLLPGVELVQGKSWKLMLVTIVLAVAALLLPVWTFAEVRKLRRLAGLSVLLNLAMLVPAVGMALDSSGLAPGNFVVMCLWRLLDAVGVSF